MCPKTEVGSALQVCFTAFATRHVDAIEKQSLAHEFVVRAGCAGRCQPFRASQALVASSDASLLAFVGVPCASQPNLGALLPWCAEGNAHLPISLRQLNRAWTLKPSTKLRSQRRVWVSLSAVGCPSQRVGVMFFWPSEFVGCCWR